MQPVGLGVLENDGSGWVSKLGVHYFFPCLTHWTIHILMGHEDTLRSVGIYDAIWAFKDRFELAIKK